MSKKKIIVLAMLALSLLMLTGCEPVPKDEAGNVILITNETTFGEMMDNEGFFIALLVYPVALLINHLSPILSVGGAIIAAAVAINVLVVALTFKSNVQTQKMQDIQPELERLKKKYEGKTDQASQQKQAMETQALWKKHGINPLGSFIGLFVQMPILIAMYHAVQRAESVATGSFLGLNLETTILEGFMNLEIGFILLFAAMIGLQMLSMYVPTMLNNIDAKKKAEAEHRKYVPSKNPMGGMMFFMVAMIGYIAFTWPSAMTLYWAISSFINISKTIIIKKMMSAKKS